MEAFPMNAGDGPQSYSCNSSYQMEGVSTSMAIVSEAIAKDEKMSKEELCSWYPVFRIADFGCSTGPNTFMVAQSMVECMHLKYNSHGLPPPDFHVFFNDLAANDFNTLFLNLPTVPGGCKYFPAGVPGSFYGRLFPEASLHFGFSSYTLHWLTQVPVTVKDRSSPAWNKGRIHLKGAPAAVARAYAEQFAEDVNKFLSARAVEMVAGGYMVLVFSSCISGSSPETLPVGRIYDMVGSTLMEMVEMGIVEEDKVDTFNLPIYFPSLEEVLKLLQENGFFNLECYHPISHGSSGRTVSPELVHNNHLRAAVETVFSTHFGADVVNQLFGLTLTKFQKNSQYIFSGQPPTDLCALLKYKHPS